MNYSIHIQEVQRKALLAIIKEAKKANSAAWQAQEKGPNTGEQALWAWEEMLAELPEAETSHPGVLHGFCL